MEEVVAEDIIETDEISSPSPTDMPQKNQAVDATKQVTKVLPSLARIIFFYFTFQFLFSKLEKEDYS